MSAEATIKAAAEKLGAEVQSEGDGFFNLTVQATVEEGEPYSELVAIYVSDGSILVRNTFGYNDGSTDLAEVLRLLSQTSYARVHLETDEESDGEYFVIEAGVPEGVPAEALASVIREVVDWSGSFRSLLPEEPGEEEA